MKPEINWVTRVALREISTNTPVEQSTRTDALAEPELEELTQLPVLLVLAAVAVLAAATELTAAAVLAVVLALEVPPPAGFSVTCTLNKLLACPAKTVATLSSSAVPKANFEDTDIDPSMGKCLG